MFIRKWFSTIGEIESSAWEEDYRVTGRAFPESWDGRSREYTFHYDDNKRYRRSFAGMGHQGRFWWFTIWGIPVSRLRMNCPGGWPGLPWKRLSNLISGNQCFIWGCRTLFPWIVLCPQPVWRWERFGNGMK